MMKASACVVAALLLAGCGGIGHETRPTVWVALGPAPAGGGLRAGGPGLEISRFATAAPFATDRVASRERGFRWAFAAYHRWVAEPGELVSSRLGDALSRADLFGAVFTGPAPIEPDFRLSGAVRKLFWDRESGSAVLVVEASLIAVQGRQCGFWVRHAAAPVPGDTVDGFLTAASTALAEIETALREDVAAALAACAPRRGP